MISYNVYWITVIAGFALLRYNEVKGHLPFMKAKKSTGAIETSSEDLSLSSSREPRKKADSDVEKAVPVVARDIEV